MKVFGYQMNDLVSDEKPLWLKLSDDNSKDDTIDVGDSPYDQKTAQNAGMRCLLVSTGTHTENELKKDGPVIVESNLLNLLENQIKPLL